MDTASNRFQWTKSPRSDLGLHVWGDQDATLSSAGGVTRRTALVAGLIGCAGARAATLAADAEVRKQLGRVWSVPPQTDLIMKADGTGLTLPFLVDGIADWLIPMSSSVTIQMPPGRHEIGRRVSYSGRDGGRVRIIGSSDPGACVLLWEQPSDLFFAPAGTVLGLVDGLTVVHEAPRRRGNGCAFLAEAGGTISCGANVRVRDFYYGFQARLGGVIRCRGTQCEGAGDAAYFAFNGGHMDAAGALAEAARDDAQRLGSGFVAEYGGTINAESAISRRNALSGFHALSNGVIRASGASAIRNGQAGFLVRTGGTIIAHGATAKDNCGPGVSAAEPHATFEARTVSFSANDREASTCSAP